MNAKIKPIFFVLIIAVLLTDYSCNSDSENQNAITNPTTINLTVKKDGKIWKVVNTDAPNDTVVLHRKDKIYWHVEGTDAYFQFPVKAKKIFNQAESDSLVGGHTTVIRNGGKLKQKIKDDPDKGTYVYAIFCMADSVFAIQGSPPVFVVR